MVNYRHNVIQQVYKIYSSCKTESSYPLNSNFPFSLPPAPKSHYSTLRFWVSLFQIPYISGIMQYLSSVWLISFSITASRFIHVSANGRISFFFKIEQFSIAYLYLQIYHTFFIHFLYLFICGQITWVVYVILTIVNNAALNLGVQLLLLDTDYSSLGIYSEVGLLHPILIQFQAAVSCWIRNESPNIDFTIVASDLHVAKTMSTFLLPFFSVP